MTFNKGKQCVTNDDGSLIKPNAYTDRDGVVSFSIASRYPLDCDHVMVEHSGYRCREQIDEGTCDQLHKRLDRWHKYLAKEIK